MSVATQTDFLVHPAKGLSLVCLAAALWATVGVANGLLSHGATVDAAFVGWLRTTLGALILLLVAESMKVPRAGPDGNQLVALLLIGIAGAVFQVSLFEAFSSIGVTITVAVTVCAPPLIVALGEAILVLSD